MGKINLKRVYHIGIPVNGLEPPEQFDTAVNDGLFETTYFRTHVQGSESNGCRLSGGGSYPDFLRPQCGGPRAAPGRCAHVAANDATAGRTTGQAAAEITRVHSQDFTNISE